MSNLLFYWAGAAFMTLWVVTSRDERYPATTLTELMTILLWPVFLVVLAICIVWILCTGRLPWQK